MKKIIRLCLQLLVASCNNSDDLGKLFEKYSFENVAESDNYFYLENDTLLFTANIDGVYRVVRYHMNKNEMLDTILTKNNTAFPFMFEDSINRLEEDGLSNTYTIKGSCQKLLGKTPFKKIVTSDGGRYILLQAKTDNSITVVDAATGKLIDIANGQETLISAAFSEKKKKLVVGSGTEMFVVDLVTSETRTICDSIKDRKLNPSIYQDSIYFSSYNADGHYAIWRVHIDDKVRRPTQILSIPGHDLRLPQRWKNSLYFINIDKSQYLLQVMDMQTMQINPVTTEGVVYNYKINDRGIMYVYTDMQTPRNIRYMDNTGTIRDVIKRKALDSSYRFRLLYKDKSNVPAFEITHRRGPDVKGVILYFHPGRNNDDYSPRWDNMIFPFCGNGYVVIAPNFPSSTGYGKAYEQTGVRDATKYMSEWIAYIKKHYPRLPVYLYGISSGCPLMEKTAAGSKKEIAGVISVFGLTQSNILLDGVPSFYLLGKHDPFIDYDERAKELTARKEYGKSVTVISLANEKHWIQHPENFRKFYREVFAFIEENR